MTAIAEWAARAGAEITQAVAAVDAADVDAAVQEIADARRIALFGVGREGLMMRALAMRLHHLGLRATPVGDMTAPALHQGDLLVASAGPHLFATVGALLGIARKAGARTLLFTAAESALLRSEADRVFRIPARTMADAAAGPMSLPMGSAYEGAQFLLFEYLVERIRQRLGVSEAAMRERHTNLE